MSTPSVERPTRKPPALSQANKPTALHARRHEEHVHLGEGCSQRTLACVARGPEEHTCIAARSLCAASGSGSKARRGGESCPGSPRRATEAREGTSCWLLSSRVPLSDLTTSLPASLHTQTMFSPLLIAISVTIYRTHKRAKNERREAGARKRRNPRRGR